LLEGFLQRIVLETINKGVILICELSLCKGVPGSESGRKEGKES
jgi:hypothetical protein